MTSTRYIGNNNKEELLFENERREKLDATNRFRKKDFEENARIEVLEEKIRIDSKNHEKEKQEIVSEKDQKIRSLEIQNENLLNVVDNKNDKIRQINEANSKKEVMLVKNDHDIKVLQKENEILKQREESLQMEIKRLENEHKEISATYKETIAIVKSQQDEIISMEIKINSLKEELEKLKAEKEEQDKRLFAQLKSMENTIEVNNTEMKIREQERERQWKEEWERREAKRDKREKEMMEDFKKLLTKSTSVIRNDIKENITPRPKENLVITKATNFSIQNESPVYHRTRTFYRQQQPANKGRQIYPFVQYTLPGATGGIRNKRGGNPKKNLYK